MSNGRNPEESSEEDAEFIASLAAPLVAAGDYTRVDAIKLAASYLRDSREADGDVTGVKEVELNFPEPSRQSSPEQIKKIKGELMDAARDAADEM